MNGIIVIDKPKGLTSRDVVNQVGRMFHMKRIGHTGTLDPLATGVLVLCLGEATKLVEYITATKKEYIAEITLGMETDTLDIEGSRKKIVPVPDIKEDQIIQVLRRFEGLQKQEVPIYSAIKVNGKKLYEYARENRPVELPIHEIQIDQIKLVDGPKRRGDQVVFSIQTEVSKGTYIRSLVRDIGNQLGYPAVMSELRRIKQGKFTIGESVTLEQIERGIYHVMPLITGVDHFEKIEVDDETKDKIQHGRILTQEIPSEPIVFIDYQQNVLALYKRYEKEPGKIKPIKVFHPEES